ncbi:MAG: sporulation protein YunB [Oscillospiraceae bacterium]|nr:sporulation protein YunB [Oscillospiraceae bacterium]
MRRLGRSCLVLPFAPRFRLRRGFRRSRLSRRGLVLLLLVAAVLIALLCAGLDARAKPQIHALASTAARQQASASITEAVQRVLAEEQVTYDRLVTIGASGAGEGGIRSIETNAMEVNLLRGKINAAAEEAVSLRDARLRLPLGALLGSDLFAGSGPKLSVPLTMTGHALSDIRSDLTSSGVNQTMHRILMDLCVTLSVILPGEIVTTEISVTVCLAETVIVGNVPNGIMSYGTK